MELYSLVRELVDIESISGNEAAVGSYLLDLLHFMSDRYDGSVEKMDVEAGRFNVFARFGEPTVTLTTHMDTVPPFIRSWEDSSEIYGRGSCDAKGILASMLIAAEQLLEEGGNGLGLLFVVGEERGSAGALHAATQPRGAKYLINGEPTENKLAIGSKGALRYEIEAHGKMAHSAYPELGDSAIDKLLDVLAAIRSTPFPSDPDLGDTTVNIGTISGGRAPNVISDYAKAELLIRLVADANPVRQLVESCAAGRAEAREVLCIDAVRLGSFPGFETMVAKYTTDIPAFGPGWGEPYLLGPGTIHVAHTEGEKIAKADLDEAVKLYKKLVKLLWAR